MALIRRHMIDQLIVCTSRDNSQVYLRLLQIITKHSMIVDLHSCGFDDFRCSEQISHLYFLVSHRFQTSNLCGPVASCILL